MAEGQSRSAPILFGALLISSCSGCDSAVRDVRSAAADSVRIEEVELDLPTWRLAFQGEVRQAVAPEELSAVDIQSLDLTFLPGFRGPGDRARSRSPAAPSAVTAQARREGRVIGERRHAYERVMIVNHDVAKEVPSLMGVIEDLPEPPDEFVLVGAGGERLFGIARPRQTKPLTLEIRRAEVRRGAVRLAWARPRDAADARFQVFLSTDRFRTYRRVQPGFSGDGERRAMRRTSYALNLTEHHVDRPELHLLVLAQDGLRVAWRTFRITLERLPEYEYRVRIDEPAEGATIPHHWFFTLNGSMDVRIETPGERYNGRPYRYEPIDATLQWSSDRDGPLVRYRSRGHGFQVSCPAHGLSPGPHHLTLTGETPAGVATSATVRVEVVAEEGQVAGGPTECHVPEAYRID